MKKRFLVTTISIIIAIVTLIGNIDVKATTSITTISNLGRYDWRTQNVKFSNEINQYLKQQFQDGNQTFICVRGAFTEKSFCDVEVYHTDQEDNYKQSDFYKNLGEEDYIREYYTIIPSQRYNSLMEEYFNDEYEIFADLVNHKQGMREKAKLASRIWRTKQPVFIETEKLDEEYLMIRATLNEYLIQEGDNLTNISNLLQKRIVNKITIEQLAKQNKIKNLNLIRAGEVLVIQ